MTFTEACSSGRDFRRVGQAVSEFFWQGEGDDATLMERIHIDGRVREPKLTWRDYFKVEFEFVDNEIGVGDVVQCTLCTGYECQVDRVQRKTASLHRVSDDASDSLCGCIKDISNMLTFISKAPKEYVFEGVCLKHYLEVDILVARGTNIALPPKGLKELADNDTVYTMTLRKEGA